jgi:translation initiation factor 1A
MVNKKGGKKHKRNKSHSSISKPLRLKDDDQQYAQIKKCKGNCRFDVFVFDGKERSAILCGSMRKRRFVKLMDVVLVSLRDFQDDICDIIDVYDDNEVIKLKQQKEIPDNIQLDEVNDYTGGNEEESYQPVISSSSEEEEEEETDIDIDEI